MDHPSNQEAPMTLRARSTDSSGGGTRAFVLAVACSLAAAAGQALWAETQPSNELHPTWSPDGSKIAFESDRAGAADIYVLDLESGKVERLTDSPADDARPAWSPDGRWIAFHSNREGNYDLFLLDVRSGGLRRLTNADRDETNAAWNPTSTQIAYENRLDESTWHIYLIDIDEGVGRSLLELPGSSLTPTWLSADRIAFSYSPAGGNHDTDLILQTVSTTGEILGPLLEGRQGSSNVAYSPVTERIAYNSIRDGNWEVYSAGFDGTAERRLTASPGEGLVGIDGQPSWSPEGLRIAITSGREGSLDILILGADGVLERNLTRDWVH